MQGSSREPGSLKAAQGPKGPAEHGRLRSGPQVWLRPRPWGSIWGPALRDMGGYLE